MAVWAVALVWLITESVSEGAFGSWAIRSAPPASVDVVRGVAFGASVMLGWMVEREVVALMRGVRVGLVSSGAPRHYGDVVATTRLVVVRRPLRHASVETWVHEVDRGDGGAESVYNVADGSLGESAMGVAA